jgi:hypothetical protein
MKIKRRTLLSIVSWGIRFLIIGLVLGTIYSYFGTPLFMITSYDISGIDAESRNAINAELHTLDKQKSYVILPRDKIFTYSGDVIINTVREIVPETATIDMRPVGLHTIKIEVTLLRPVFRVSGTQGVTTEGIIFSTKYDIHTYPLITIASSTTKIIKNEGLPFTEMVLPDGNTTTKFFTDLSSITSKISSIIFTVSSIVVEDTGDVTCISLNGLSKVLLLQDADMKKVWSTLVSAIDTDPLKAKLATNRTGLEYLDARYGNKVFYRFNDMLFQNGTVTGILGNHATSTQEFLQSTSSIR